MSQASAQPWRVKTPTVIQMEAVECGAAALSIVLAHYGRYIPLEELRVQCGVSRDGCDAFNLVEAAKFHGLDAAGYELEVEELEEISHPSILFWNFNHFVVLEGLDAKGAWINDPASGPRHVPQDTFLRSYSKVAISLEPREDFQKYGRAPRLLDMVLERTEKARGALPYILFAQLLIVILGLVVPTFSQLFLDNIVQQGMLGWRVPLLSMMAVVGGLLGTVTGLRGHVLKRLGAKLSLCLSSEFLWHTLRLPIFFFYQRFGGEIIYRIALNLTVTERLSGELSVAVVNVAFILIYGIAMVQYDLAITGIGILAAVSNLAMLLVINRSRTNAYARLQQEQAKMQGISVDTLYSIETIKASGGESYFFSRVAGYFTKNVNAWQEIGRRDVWLTSITGLVNSLAQFLLLSVGVWRVMHGSLTIGMLIAFQMLMNGFLRPFGQLVSFGTQLQTLKVDLGRLKDVLDHPTDPLVAQKKEEASAERLEGKLELKEVSFGYSPLDDPLFDKLTFSIQAGERVGLVGPSGAGKSSIVHLAAGLFPPWKGKVLYDGKERSAIANQTITASIGTVDQQVFLFAGTILENLTLWDSSVAESDVTEACQDACIHDEVVARQGGYLAQLIEGGNNLSGGQRQRLEIARALVRKPSILILDEATAALDTDTEARVLKNIEKRGCATLVITHRLSTIKNCDRILVLDHGRIVASGTHEELIKQEGLYRQMYIQEAFDVK